MKKNKFLLIGYGNMGKDWGRIIKENKNVEVVGVVDILKINREQAIKDFSLQDNKVFGNLKEALKKLKIDAVIDSSPPFAHYDNAKKILKKSIHILGEKPMSLSIKEARDLVKLSKDKIYMINQNYRRNPVIEIIRNSIPKIGKIYSVEIDYHQILKFKDTFRYKFSHPLLLDMAIHHFDLVRYITNSNAISVYAIEQNPKSSKFINGSSTYVTFKMDNDVILNYRGSWSSNRPNSSFNGIWHIIGEYGSLYWDGDCDLFIEKNNNKQLTIKIKNKILLTPYDVFVYELKKNLELFIFSINNNVLPDSWCGDNINSLKMIVAAVESSEKETKIKIN